MAANEALPSPTPHSAWTSRDLLLASGLVPLVLFGVFAVWSWSDTMSDARSRVDRVASAVEDHARRVFEVQNALLTSTLAHARGLSFDEIEGNARLQAFLDEIDVITPSSRAIILVRPDKATIAVRSHGRLAATDVSERDYFRAHRGSGAETYFGQIIRAVPSDIVGFTMSHRDGTTGLIAVSLLGTEDFQAFFASLSESDRDEVGLVREDGAVLVSARERPPGARLADDSVAARFMRGEIAGHHVAPSVLDGVERLWTVRRVGGTPVHVYYGLDMARVHAAWYKRLVPFGALSVLASSLLLLLARRMQRAADARRLAELDAAFTRARAEHAELLAANEERLRLFIEQAPSAIAMFDREMRYLAVSQRWISDYRLDRSPVGRLHDEVFPYRSETWEAARRRGLGGAVQRSEGERFERADGSAMWIRWELRPWYYPTGTLGGLLIATENVTQQHQAEAALRASEARYRTAFEISNVGKMHVDAITGRYVLVNDAFCEIVGYTRDELMGLRPADLIHPDDAVWDNPLAAAFMRGETDRYAAEKRFVRKDGRIIWVAVNCGLIRDFSGRPRHSVGVQVDITARKFSEMALLRHAERQALLLDLTSALIGCEDAGELGRVVFERIAPVFEADVCFNYRLDATNGSLELVFQRGVPPAQLGEAQRLAIEEAFCSAAADGQAVVADAARIASDPKGAFLRGLGITAYVCQPLRAPDGQMFGTFSVGSATRARFLPDEVAWLGTLANFVSQAWRRLETDAALRRSEERLRDAHDAAALGTWEMALTQSAQGELVQTRGEWSARLRDLLEVGADEPASIALLMTRVHPQDRPAIEQTLQTLLAKPDGIHLHHAEYRLLLPSGIERWIEDQGRVETRTLAGSSRTLVGTGIARDISGKKATAEALRLSERRFRRAADAARELVYEAGVPPASAAIARVYGVEHVVGEKPEGDALETRWWHERIHPDDLPAHLEYLERCRVDPGCVDYHTSYRVRHADGSWREVEDNAQILRNPDGVVRRLVGTIIDITERKRAEAELRESEATFRAMFSVSSVGKCQIDLHTGRFLRVNKALCDLTGYSEEELLERTFSDITHPDHRAYDREKVRRMVSGEEPTYDVEKRYVRKDGSVIWVRVNANVIRDEQGQALRNTAIVQDITERKRHEQHVQMLMREVNHRAKNMLTIVQAIARQTAAATPDQFIERFTQRIQALAANQDLLVENEWRGVDLAVLARSQLDPFADLIGNRIALSGPPLRLSPAAAQAIGMALHELSTNANKYGALSNDVGHVVLTWALTPGEDGRFEMTWSERDGPPVAPPTRRGFGTTVMSTAAKATLNGSVDLQYAASGLVWRLECPAAEALERFADRAPPLQPAPVG
ncbi:MAG: PAS domain S-box protein [Hyphomicrobiales bacterium]|nr:PAS domain S-box protein [Hyphomicrobiales bacterium]